MVNQVIIEVAVNAGLVSDICRLVRERSSSPMEGLAALVGSIWMLKAMYAEAASDESLEALVGALMRSSPKVVHVQDPAHLN